MYKIILNSACLLYETLVVTQDGNSIRTSWWSFNIVGVESDLFQMKFSSTYIVVNRD